MNEKNLIKELDKIRKIMEFNIPKAKQMLTNLMKNIAEQKGVCFK